MIGGIDDVNLGFDIILVFGFLFAYFVWRLFFNRREGNRKNKIVKAIIKDKE
ncbi:hypothetical protein [Candidatus Enterovibrio escicola]|uniref:Uncharacterized protein n=1 Tax=Candidatus Enterovibrio escicola TaxID=1927127 RepID=A0A2A5T0T9_9GAMM|nr:hypothetical protein [Candidatus Enterovibrio escacola]PCS21740.1 hypothetical protein BTN49_2752 [Candidatus Enterovibrio escacola]